MKELIVQDEARLPPASSPGCLPSSIPAPSGLPYPPGIPAEGPGTPVSARQEQPASRDSGPACSAPHDTPTEPREAAATVRGLDKHRGPREPAGAPATETRWVPPLLSLRAVYPGLPCRALRCKGSDEWVQVFRTLGISQWSSGSCCM